LNSAVFERIEFRNGEVATVKCQPPFDRLLGLEKFEYDGMELQTRACSNYSDMRTRLEKLAAAIRPQ